jgi:hypothetical protein
LGIVVTWSTIEAETRLILVVNFFEFDGEDLRVRVSVLASMDPELTMLDVGALLVADARVFVWRQSPPDILEQSASRTAGLCSSLELSERNDEATPGVVWIDTSLVYGQVAVSLAFLLGAPMGEVEIEADRARPRHGKGALVVW